MTDLQIFYGEWGLLVVLLVSLGEFVGVPIAAAPLLFLAGVLATSAGGAFWPIPVVATVGAFLGDLLWFLLATHRSRTVVDRACGLTSNPWACVIFTRRKIPDMGRATFLVSHFLPGTGNLVASAAGLAGIPGRRFLPLDALALALWATVWSGAGWAASPRVGRFLPDLESNLLYVLVAALGLMIFAGVWRVHKVRLHKGLHVRDGQAR